jgi:hypothetical protein
MYTAVLTIHSWMRWVTLLAALGATLNAFRTPLATDERLPGRMWDTLFMAAVDLQVLFGLLLYFGLSPFTKEAMENFGAAMKNGGLRFWAVEHLAGMLLVIVLVRMGRIMGANARPIEKARMRRLVFFTLAVLVMLASIPWPGLTNGRPLFRI